MASIPMQEGLFGKDESGVCRLIASRCTACNLVFFPKRKFCGRCAESNLQEIYLSQRGKVYAFSLIDRKSKYTVVEPPYIQAEVEMPEGVHVFTVLDGCNIGSVAVGMDVEVYVGNVTRDESGNDVAAYKFRPVKESARETRREDARKP
jgi:uncharacterized OB-fold protein